MKQLIMDIKQIIKIDRRIKQIIKIGGSLTIFFFILAILSIILRYLTQ